MELYAKMQVLTSAVLLLETQTGVYNWLLLTFGLTMTSYLRKFLFWFMSVVTILFLEIMSVRDINGPCSGKMKTSSPIPECANIHL
jgi:hypothetical protein